MKALGSRIQTQYGGLSILLAKARTLEAVSDKIRSDPAKIAIKGLLGVVASLCSGKEELVRAFNTAAADIKSFDVKNTPRAPRSSRDTETQSPC